MLPDIALRRLRTQRLVGTPFDSAVDAVGFLGAVQSQDYAGAKWALGQRSRGATEADIDRLFDEGAILRTHVMRPTWHFVLPQDIRWMLDLTGPRVKAKVTHRLRQLEIDSTLLRRCHGLIEKTLGGGNAMTRNEIGAALERAGLHVANERLGHTLAQAELDGLIVSGPRQDKQQTHALLDERAPETPRLGRDEALAELTRRYFTGHGPAQLQDFTWWSGLTIADGRRGLEIVGNDLQHEQFGEKSYWSSPDAPRSRPRGPVVHLLPNYDEFLVAYRDRSDSLDPARNFDMAPFPNGSLLAHVVVVQGQVWGGWRRKLAARPLVVELQHLDVLSAPERAALLRAANDLGRFSSTPVSVVGLAA
jgi:hypothetical protein